MKDIRKESRHLSCSRETHIIIMHHKKFLMARLDYLISIEVFSFEKNITIGYRGTNTKL